MGGVLEEECILWYVKLMWNSNFIARNIAYWNTATPPHWQPRPLPVSHAHSLTHLWWSSSLSQLEKMSRKSAWTQGVNDGLWCVLRDWGGVGTQLFLRQVTEVPHLQNRVKSQRGKKRSSFNAEWTFHAWYWCVFMCLDTDTQCYSSMRHCLHSTLELHLPLK